MNWSVILSMQQTREHIVFNRFNVATIIALDKADANFNNHTSATSIVTLSTGQLSKWPSD